MKGDLNMKRTYKFVRDIIKSAEDSMIITITSQHNLLLAYGHWYNDSVIDYESRLILSQWQDKERDVWHVII